MRSMAAPAGGISMPSGISIHWWMRSSCGMTILPALADAELADHGEVRAPQHLDDFAIGSPAGFDAGDADQHAIAVHGFLGRIGRQEDVALNAFDGMIGDQETVAIAM